MPAEGIFPAIGATIGQSAQVAFGALMPSVERMGSGAGQTQTYRSGRDLGGGVYDLGTRPIVDGYAEWTIPDVGARVVAFAITASCPGASLIGTRIGGGGAHWRPAPSGSGRDSVVAPALPGSTVAVEMDTTGTGTAQCLLIVVA